MRIGRTLPIFALAAAVAGASRPARAEDNGFAVPASEAAQLAKAPADPTKITFKPGKGLSISSADNRFELNIGVRGQFLYTFEREPAEPKDDLTHKFEVRRLRVTMTGHMFGEHNQYKLELGLSPKDMGLSATGGITKQPVLDFSLDFTHLRDLSVIVGQFKVPFSRERTNSSSAMQLVDRSSANGEFNLDRDMGFSLYSKDVAGIGYLRWFAGIYVGENFSSFRSSDFGMLYSGRVEVYPLGIYSDAGTMSDLSRSRKARLALGGAFAYLDEAKGVNGNLGSAPSDGGTTDTQHATADLQFKIAGFSLESAFHWRTGKRNPGPLVDDLGSPLLDDDGNPLTAQAPRDGVGWYAQAGFMIPHAPVEIAARYGQIRPLGDNTSLEASDELVTGVNWFIAHHAFKIQADYTRGWAPTAGISHGSDEVRLSMQAML